jgi:hypothetical protein
MSINRAGLRKRRIGECRCGARNRGRSQETGAVGQNDPTTSATTLASTTLSQSEPYQVGTIRRTCESLYGLRTLLTQRSSASVVAAVDSAVHDAVAHNLPSTHACSSDIISFTYPAGRTASTLQLAPQGRFTGVNPSQLRVFRYLETGIHGILPLGNVPCRLDCEGSNNCKEW